MKWTAAILMNAAGWKEKIHCLLETRTAAWRRHIFSESNAAAYAIYQDKTVVGLVIILDRPEESDKYYSFTDLFIADDYQGKGYGKEAVQAIIDKLRHEKKRSAVEIQVHKANAIAKKIYLQSGFVKIKDSDSDNDFEVMRLAL